VDLASNSGEVAALNHMTSTSTALGSGKKEKKKLIINFSISSFFHHHSLYPILDKKTKQKEKPKSKKLKKVVNERREWRQFLGWSVEDGRSRRE